jgi:hypothetical protein
MQAAFLQEGMLRRRRYVSIVNAEQISRCAWRGPTATSVRSRAGAPWVPPSKIARPPTRPPPPPPHPAATAPENTGETQRINYHLSLETGRGTTKRTGHWAGLDGALDGTLDGISVIIKSQEAQDPRSASGNSRPPIGRAETRWNHRDRRSARVRGKLKNSTNFGAKQSPATTHKRPKILSKPGWGGTLQVGWLSGWHVVGLIAQRTVHRNHAPLC